MILISFDWTSLNLKFVKNGKLQLEQAKYSSIVYEDFLEEFQKFFLRVNSLRKTMLKAQAESIGYIDNFEQILLEMFVSSGETFDYMVLIIRFFISAYFR